MKSFIVKLILIFVIIFGAIFLTNKYIPKPDYYNNFQISNVFAESTAPIPNPGDSQEGKTEQTAKGLEGILRIMFVILWPFLRIAGLALDNSLVYGSVFNLDKYLWMLWNIMKNFANYILGFVFIASLFVYFFNVKSGKLGAIADPKKIIPQLLIGGILIQSSWFLMGALIDISTILTYSLGALPLHMIKGDSLYNTPTLIPDITWNLNSSQQGSSGTDIVVVYSCGEKKLAPCVFSGMEFNKDGFEQLKSDLGKQTGKNMESQACVMGSKPYDIKKLEEILGKKGGGELPSCEEAKSAGGEKSGGKKDLSQALWTQSSGEGSGQSMCSSTLGNIVNKSKAGMVGPLYTMYGSILSMSDIAVTSSNKSSGVLAGQFLLQGLIAFALMLPLLTLCVVLLMRVVILRVVIGMSPMLFLTQVFNFKIGNDKDLNAVLTLIFMPAVTVFALSISIVFLTLLQNPGQQDGNSRLLQALNLSQCIDKKGSSGGQGGNMDKLCYKSHDTGQINCFSVSSKSIGEFIDLIPWLVVNFIGIGLMWTLVFAAMNTSKMTAKVSQQFQSFGQSMVKGTQLIPGVPGSSIAGLSSIPNLIERAGRNRISDEASEASNAVQGVFGGGGGSGNTQPGDSTTPPATPPTTPTPTPPATAPTTPTTPTTPTPTSPAP